MACYTYAMDFGVLMLESKRLRIYRFIDERVTRIIDAHNNVNHGSTTTLNPSMPRLYGS